MRNYLSGTSPNPLWVISSQLDKQINRAQIATLRTPHPLAPAFPKTHKPIPGAPASPPDLRGLGRPGQGAAHIVQSCRAVGHPLGAPL